MNTQRKLKDDKKLKVIKLDLIRSFTQRIQSSEHHAYLKQQEVVVQALNHR